MDDELLPEDNGESGSQLLEQDGATTKVQIADVAARWSSTHSMLQRAVAIRRGLDLVAGSDEDLRIRDCEWKSCEDVLELLTPFAVVTKFLAGVKYPTLSCVIPLYNTLMDNLEAIQSDANKSEDLKNAAGAAFKKIEKCYNKTTPVYLVATVLDPRLKLDYFIRHGWTEGRGVWDGRNLVEENVKPA